MLLFCRRRRLLLKFITIAVISVLYFWLFCVTTVFQTTSVDRQLFGPGTLHKRNAIDTDDSKSKRKMFAGGKNKSLSSLSKVHFQGMPRYQGWERDTNSTNGLNETGSSKLHNKYFLSAIIMVRIYKDDLAKWTIRELKQWMHYLFYAGVEHIYVCDHYVLERERLKDLLSKYIDKRLLTYIDWPWNASRNDGYIMTHQVMCYTHVIRTFGADSRWQTSIDMDEYPFCRNDFHPNFLSNYLKRIEKDRKFKSVSQILMQNFLMLGQGDRTQTMTIERINRITKTIANNLTKPIFKPSDIADIDIHKHYPKYGKSIHANISDLQMLHYWGARLQNWGPDTKEIINKTDKFTYVATYIAPLVRKALISFGEDDAFSNETGP